MKYDFEKMTDRRHTNAYKWDVDEQVLPMWVADMDFETAPEIIAAIQSKVSKGILGYTAIPQEWSQAYQHWWLKEHNLEMDEKSLVFATGVVPILSSAVRKFTQPGDNVVIQTPVYNIFFNSIVNNGCQVLENPLKFDGTHYSMDFEDLETKLSDPKTTLMILCNPHNPIGKIWDLESLKKVGDLCQKHHVLVISDEIHCDLTQPGNDYIPFATVSETCAQNSITCIAPTKAFNLAGIHSAAAYVPNPDLFHRLNRALNTDEVAEPNAIAMEATIAAFRQGKEWLNQLKEVIFAHRQTAKEFIDRNLPQLKLIESDATYLLWIDCREITQNSQEYCDFLLRKVGLKLSSGESYGASGKGFIRMNIACPEKRLVDGLERLSRGTRLFIEQQIS